MNSCNDNKNNSDAISLVVIIGKTSFKFDRFC